MQHCGIVSLRNKLCRAHQYIWSEVLPHSLWSYERANRTGNLPMSVKDWLTDYLLHTHISYHLISRDYCIWLPACHVNRRSSLNAAGWVGPLFVITQFTGCLYPECSSPQFMGLLQYSLELCFCSYCDTSHNDLCYFCSLFHFFFSLPSVSHHYSLSLSLALSLTPLLSSPFLDFASFSFFSHVCVCYVLFIFPPSSLCFLRVTPWRRAQWEIACQPPVSPLLRRLTAILSPPQQVSHPTSQALKNYVLSLSRHVSGRGCFCFISFCLSPSLSCCFQPWKPASLLISQSTQWGGRRRGGRERRTASLEPLPVRL